MKRIFTCTLGALFFGAMVASVAHAADPKYKNFRVAIFARSDSVRQFANPQSLATAYDAMDKQVKFDKVYLDVSGSSDASLEAIKKFFNDKGIITSGAMVTPNGSYTSQQNLDRIKSSVELAARHFDEIILDDWFFTMSKTAADIAAKGDKTWTQYRLEALDNAAENYVVKPGKAINPKFRAIIKFPNWYEHYQAMGYDLEAEPKIFDAIYTGVETRDPVVGEQHLQQYESYNIIRYLESVKPGLNDGGWVDTLDMQYADRYPEQIWDMAFSKPKEIMLWNWADAMSRINLGNRPWQDQDTSFNYQKTLAAFGITAPPADQTAGRGRGGGGAGSGLTTGQVAGVALQQLDSFLGKLSKPIGIAGYRPAHSIGEEFYYDYLGMSGIPIELSVNFPTDASVCLLTAGAANDPDIITKIKGQLAAGKTVVITAGLLRALPKGINEISEFEYTDQKAQVTNFRVRLGRPVEGATTLEQPVIFPIIHFITNQSWGNLNGYNAKSPENAYPIILYDQYDRGSLYVLALPDNIADLYHLPPQVLNVIRSQIMGSFPIRLADAPGQVSLFAYDNNSFVVQSFLPTATTVSVALAGSSRSITDLVNGQTISASAAPAGGGRGGAGGGGGGGGRGRGGAAPSATFTITIPPHSYRAFTPGN
jgi:hypothetical protein